MVFILLTSATHAKHQERGGQQLIYLSKAPILHSVENEVAFIANGGRQALAGRVIVTLSLIKNQRVRFSSSIVRFHQTNCKNNLISKQKYYLTIREDSKLFVQNPRVIYT